MTTPEIPQNASVEKKPLLSELHGIPLQEELANMDEYQLVRRFVDIGDRGLVDMRLHVPLPPDVYGEWVSNTPEKIVEAMQLGFVVDTKYATKYALHSNGSGEPIVGDVIHMIIPKKVKDAMSIASQIRYQQVHGIEDGKPLKEDSDFESLVSSAKLALTFKGEKINRSSNTLVNASQINSTIKAAGAI